MIINRCDRCHAEYHGSNTDVYYPYVAWRSNGPNSPASAFRRHFDLCPECLHASKTLMEELSKQINAFLGSDPE